ncbi:MAG: secondary thiamine-phosphate synthase enzyme YjbQ [Spirochaetales bacterium]|nr:secondary thiamine-phosphate synthase enzyme YjbQ [Spirochaetales bacterium]
MICMQRVLSLRPRERGFHLVTRDIESALPELAAVEQGLAHVMILHTSAGLSLNENADPDVRTDMATIFDALVPEGNPDYVHTIEGPDDMPAHAKATLTGNSVTIPVRDGRFLLGTWQGIYLCEFRNSGGSRRIAVTVIGTSA